MRPLARLRWQLTLSHLTAIAVTLVSMVAAVVLIAGGWFAAQQNPRYAPAADAQEVASAIGGLVARGDTASELNVVLAALARGDLRLASDTRWGPGAQQHNAWFEAPLRDVAFIIVLGRDGQVLASSEPSGAAFAPPDRAAWDGVARAALAGVQDRTHLVAAGSAGSVAAWGAYPVLDATGQPGAAVLVGTRRPLVADDGLPFWSRLVFFSAASAVVLAGASIFALISAATVGYLLSRRLVARLERLGRGVESLAAGDLSRRVEEGPPDEVGQLARRFNNMADRLASTIAELEAARMRTEAALRAKRELVANVSHELRTPLALIRGHVESLLLRGRGDGDERQHEYLALIHRETEQLSRLIDDLFALSTAEAGALPLHLAPVALGEVVADVAGSIGPIARRERGITLVASVAPDLPPVLADHHRVVQVLGNLVRNALRHTPEGGLIAVRAAAQDGLAAVTVEDTGEGIPPERLPHIFERFYRGDDARDRASGGAGLGLAIVREFVEAMGGDVSVESTPAQGSRFTFRLPLAPAAAGAPADPAHTSG